MDRSSKSKLLESRIPKRRSVGKPRHFYLILDDWSWGYSIRKIDMSFGDPGQKLIHVSDSDKRRAAICTGVHRLPSPMYRFQGRRGMPKSILGVVDRMILAMPPLDYELNTPGPYGCTVIDIDAQTFISGPRCPNLVNPICIPVDGSTLFCLDGSSCWMLCQVKADGHYRHFVWRSIELPMPVFQFEHVISYAVHPEEHTIFITKFSGVPVTFSIHIADLTLGGEWKELGYWPLPFIGRGYYDPELEAWVGLSALKETNGHICACEVVSTNTDSSHQQCPALRVSKEKLFSEASGERHIGANLIYMGGESKFCLLEGICIQAGLHDQPAYSREMNEYSVGEESETDSDEMNEYAVVEVKGEQYKKRFLRLMTFSLKYDNNGDLTTGDSRRVSYYIVPDEVDDSILKYPLAFWM